MQPSSCCESLDEKVREKIGQATSKRPRQGAALLSCASACQRRRGKMVSCCSPLVGLVVHVVGHVLDVIRAEALTEGRHGVLAVGDLSDDRVDIVPASEVLFQCVLLDLLLGHDSVVAASM